MPSGLEALALRRFGVGDSANELLRAFPPAGRLEFGRYGVYSYSPGQKGPYFTSLQVVARDGKLLSAQAHSCEWEFCFFNIEDAELTPQYEAYVRQKYPDAFKPRTNCAYGPKDPRRWGLKNWGQ